MSRGFLRQEIMLPIKHRRPSPGRFSQRGFLIALLQPQGLHRARVFLRDKEGEKR
ncbi:uncharacterized protein EI90DRAFT_3086000 [Cantharellus anzutake]|uniref:uncharacterized protein n=1 Tax=Cantharellus anzutake TaxID=1750568 RepID=UPI0019034DA8|nr:uncharacterized protein EI90DRAFT_3086000 [Cantharellus anzutake]KAF8316723.1 hypothetical protein EI90DRAFT_3086000 [Cantharellus anzutake]